MSPEQCYSKVIANLLRPHGYERLLLKRKWKGRVGVLSPREVGQGRCQEISGARGQNGASEEERDPELAWEAGPTTGRGMGSITAKPGKATSTLDARLRDPVNMVAKT
jgi:hypothetical protein